MYLDRIDTLELFAVIMLALPSDLELKLSRIWIFYLIDVIGVFGFKNDIEFSRDEFFLYLDSLFRGLSKLLIVQGQNKPTYKIKRIASKDIETLVSWIYNPGEDYINREEFLG